jgi:tetratricopeptide (TPR) repeat protein
VDHINTANTVNNVGITYHSKGKYDEAIAQYEQALRIYERAFGSDHIRMADTINNIGSVYFAQGKCRDAVTLYEHALRISNRNVKSVQFVIHNAYCDGCLAKLTGYRYKCRVCKDCDLCLACFNQCAEVHSHNFVQIPSNSWKVPVEL